MNQPLQALYQEHESIAAVLHALQALAREAAQGKRVDRRVFRAILHYLDVFPEKFHHPKEDEMLFKAVQSRGHAADAVIERLKRQHEAGAAAIRALEQALARWEQAASDGSAERSAFANDAAVFVARYREHMRLEEDELMPIAKQVLTGADWAEIESAFADHRDPLHGTTADSEATLMLQRILRLAPAPIGTAPPLP